MFANDCGVNSAVDAISCKVADLRSSIVLVMCLIHSCWEGSLQQHYSRFDLLEKRSPLGWLRERDIDLLLCTELYSNVVLQKKLFTIAWPGKISEFVGAWVSHAETDGESDLIVAYQCNAQKFIILLENKIAAGFQPEQGARYRARANRWKKDECAEVITLLLAPKDYLSRPGADHFDRHFSYEDMVVLLQMEDDIRTIFFANAIGIGVENYRKGYCAVPNENVSDLWTSIWEIATQNAVELNMLRPSEKPGRSTWIYFRQPQGFTSNDAKRCSLVLKAERGQADLQFRNMNVNDLHQLVEHFLEKDMEIVKATKSASIRLSVPLIDFDRPASEQIEQINSGLQSIERLRLFYLKNSLSSLSIETQLKS